MSVRVAVAAFAVLVAAVACDSGDPAPTTVPTPSSRPSTAAPTTQVTTSAPTASATPSPPAQPALSRQDSPAGAESFARYWLAALDYATTSGDTGPLRTLGKCASCVALAESIDSLYAKGGHAEGGKITIVDSSVVKHVPTSAALVRVDYDQSLAREIPANGAPKIVPAARGLAFAFTLSREGSRWTVIKLQTIRTN